MPTAAPRSAPGSVPRSRHLRRGFLAALGVGAASTCSNDDDAREQLRRALASTTTIAPTSSTAPPAPVLPGDPFTLGVASGDPRPDRVILWTRPAPTRPTAAACRPRDVPVIWEVGTDDTFATLAASGITTSTERFGHSVHVDAEGLSPTPGCVPVPGGPPREPHRTHPHGPGRRRHP